jgi:DNA modification methylase
LSSGDLLLDPFCGTGTTLIEAKLHGIPSVGCDAHPFAVLVSRVKVNADLDCELLRDCLKQIIGNAAKQMQDQRLQKLSFIPDMAHDDGSPFTLRDEELEILPTGFVSEQPLKRLLILRDEIDELCDKVPVREFFYVALAHAVANGAGNFAFGPEIYRTKPKDDYDVLGHFARQSNLMISDLHELHGSIFESTAARVHFDDARVLTALPIGISAVITSPPYPNEKDYTRTTRVESLLLKLFSNRADLRMVKEKLLRSNTRNIFVSDKDGRESEQFESIRRVCDAIEARRKELRKTSGFEKLYHKVVSHYFGGMRRHFRSLRQKLRPGSRLAYVVGDQLSFLMVPVRTASLLGEVAEAEGFKVIGCDLWRERVGTKIRNAPTNGKGVRIAEEVLILEAI